MRLFLVYRCMFLVCSFFIVCFTAGVYQKMDTSTGLSSIASLSLVVSMSMSRTGRAMLARSVFNYGSPRLPLLAIVPATNISSTLMLARSSAGAVGYGSVGGCGGGGRPAYSRPRYSGGGYSSTSATTTSR